MAQIVYLEDRKTGLHCYTPEMGDRKPNVKMEARRGHYGKHVYIDTTETLKGRGIEFLKTYSENDFTKPNFYKVGWNEYRVTDLAFEKLQTQYSISMKCLLD